MKNLGYRVKFQHKKKNIYDATGELIGIGEQTRGNFFYADLYDDTCFFAQLDDV